MWELRQYRTEVDDFLEGCDEDMHSAISQRLDALSEQGSNSRSPVSEKMVGTDGIFECRCRAGRMQSRLLFFFQPGKKIVFVVAAFKDQRKLHKDEIKKAEKRKREILDGSEKPNDYNVH